MKLARTSVTHPLIIEDIRIPGKGTIGLTFCPGKIDDRAMTGSWDRDLDIDIEAIAEWKPDLILTLMESHEFALLQRPELPQAMTNRFPGWRHLPVVDLGVPDEVFQQSWNSIGPEARSALRNGGRVLVHCRGGIGRTGVIGAQLLMEFGATADEAIGRVRKNNSARIETREQEVYVRAQELAYPVKDRVYGMMLGAAIGDALGSAFEFMSSESIRCSVGSAFVREYCVGQ